MASIRRTTITVRGLAVLCVASAAATERRVPGEYATIQAAIDACVAGDEVIIADGTYAGTGNKNLDFHGLAITVRSASGDPALCIIDCEGSARGFYFHSGESAASRVADLTIRNGYTTTGSPGGTTGGGVYIASSSPTLTDCTITGNTGGSGGGLYCRLGSSPKLTNCTITGNTADYGGGAFCQSATPTLTNCTIAGNTAIYGGGVFCMIATPTLANCTITGNTAIQGGGVHSYQQSNPTLTNCILWADAPEEISVLSGSLIVAYCDVQGGWGGTGNIDADPLFRDPDGPDDDPNTVADNDYRLAFDSPCLDVGDNSVVPAGSLDLDGRPRIARFVVDMGAYEIPFGDIDCSGAINFGDINPFVLLLTNPPAYAQMYPDCPPLHGDLDANGEVGFGDINPFVAALTGSK